MSFFLFLLVKFEIPTIHKVRNIRFFVGKVFSESQKWTKKMSKNRKRRFRVAKTRVDCIIEN
jgi:hypothetical protein